jgi:ribosomal protein S18 acetylase RimI-like enzyme
MQTSDGSVEILDLRHFAAPVMRPLLEAEGTLWEQRLHWDYRASSRLLMQYLDNHMLHGYTALEGGRVAGMIFCVYEETKAVIGDVFALPPAPEGPQGLSAPARVVEEKLLRHLLELLLNSPHVDRVESQMLLHPAGTLSIIFQEAGFRIFRRLYLVESLRECWAPPDTGLGGGLEMRPWRETDLAPASRLIFAAYQDHPDSLINDQYRSAHGSMRFLNNIVRYAGCGSFVPQASYVVAERANNDLAALVLSSRVSDRCGHLTQVCVHPGFRRRGLARLLLAQAAFSFRRLGLEEISLTVTEANATAIELYKNEGYECLHSFDAAVWQRDRIV